MEELTAARRHRALPLPGLPPRPVSLPPARPGPHGRRVACGPARPRRSSPTAHAGELYAALRRTRPRDLLNHPRPEGATPMTTAVSPVHGHASPPTPTTRRSRPAAAHGRRARSAPASRTSSARLEHGRGRAAPHRPRPVASITIKRPRGVPRPRRRRRGLLRRRPPPEIAFCLDAARPRRGRDGRARRGADACAAHARARRATGTYVAPIEDLYGGLRAALDLTADDRPPRLGPDLQAQLPGGGDVLSWNVALSIHLELVAD